LIFLTLILSLSLCVFLSFSKMANLTGQSEYRCLVSKKTTRYEKVLRERVSICLNFTIRKEVNQMTKTMKKNGRKQVKKAEGKKPKDPKRVEAAKKAWETIRAKAKEKHVIK